MSTRSITVNIGGLQLPVRTSASDAEVAEIVSLIQTKLKDVQRNAPAQSLHKDLALVAMSLAQELLQARGTQARIEEESQTLAHALLQTLDEPGR